MRARSSGGGEVWVSHAPATFPLVNVAVPETSAAWIYLGRTDDGVELGQNDEDPGSDEGS